MPDELISGFKIKGKPIFEASVFKYSDLKTYLYFAVLIFNSADAKSLILSLFIVISTVLAFGTIFIPSSSISLSASMDKASISGTTKSGLNFRIRFFKESLSLIFKTKDSSATCIAGASAYLSTAIVLHPNL